MKGEDCWPTSNDPNEKYAGEFSCDNTVMMAESFGGYVFLDIDGVLLPFPGDATDKFSDSCVAALSKILEATAAKLVLSSTWRVNPHAQKHIIQEFQRWANANGGGPLASVDDFPLITDPAKHSVRQHEVYEWLQQRHPQTYEIPWVALDDDKSLKSHSLYRRQCKPHTVETDSRVGLTDADANTAIEILRRYGKPFASEHSRSDLEIASGPGKNSVFWFGTSIASGRISRRKTNTDIEKGSEVSVGKSDGPLASKNIALGLPVKEGCKPPRMVALAEVGSNTTLCCGGSNATARIAGRISKSLRSHERELLAAGHLRDRTHASATSAWLTAASGEPTAEQTLVYRPMGDTELDYLRKHQQLPGTQPYQAIIESEQGRIYAEKYLRGHKKVDTKPTSVVEFRMPAVLIERLFAIQHKVEDGAISMGLGCKAGKGLPLFNSALADGRGSWRLVCVKRRLKLKRKR